MTDDISAWKQDIADVWNRLHTLEHRLQVRNTAKGDAPPPPPPPCVAAAQLVIPPPSASSTHDAIIPAAQHHQHTRYVVCCSRHPLIATSPLGSIPTSPQTQTHNRHHDPVLELLHKPSVLGVTPTRPHIPPPLRAHPRAQWIQCDLSSTDLTPLGKFGVVMLDPPWCPGATGSKGSKANTLPDDVIKGLALDRVQDEGLILLWVAGWCVEGGGGGGILRSEGQWMLCVLMDTPLYTHPPTHIHMHSYTPTHKHAHPHQVEQLMLGMTAYSTGGIHAWMNYYGSNPTWWGPRALQHAWAPGCGMPRNIVWWVSRGSLGGCGEGWCWM